MNPRLITIALSTLVVAMLAATAVLWGLGATPDPPVGWGTGGFVWITLLMSISVPAVGALISFRQPGNMIGWICLGTGVLLAFPVDAYGSFGRLTGSSPLPGVEFAIWLNAWTWLPAVSGIGVFLILLFPNGRAPSPRWRVVAYVCLAIIVLATISIAFTPGALNDSHGLVNPYPIRAAAHIPGRVEGGGNVLLAPCFLAAALSLVLRFRRARGRERLQFKWLAFAAALLASLFALVITATVVTGLLDVVRPNWLGVLEDATSASAIGIPIAIGIAVLRHDLYEIDAVINRTLVYAALTATLAAAYLGIVLLLQLLARPLTQDSGPAIAISTLAVAALFRPARDRIQFAVDRRFYRRKYDLQRTLEAFSERLRDEVELGSLSAALGGVVRETLQPAHLSLWLAPRRGTDDRPAHDASRTADSAGAT